MSPKLTAKINKKSERKMMVILKTKLVKTKMMMMMMKRTRMRMELKRAILTKMKKKMVQKIPRIYISNFRRSTMRTVIAKKCFSNTSV